MNKDKCKDRSSQLTHFAAINSSMQGGALSVDGVLEHVLRLLPQRDRLGAAALVCKQWHAATLSVTAETGVLLPKCRPLSEQWLRQYGAPLKALVVHSGKISAEGPTSSVTCLRQLTRLELQDVTSKSELLRSIGDSMQALCHLGLVNLCWGPLISVKSRQQLAAAANALWQGCQHLTYLQAEQCDLDDDCVRSLCASLQHLRTLDLSNNSIADARSLGALPRSLTEDLYLGNNSEYLDPSRLLQSSCSSNASTGGTAQDPAEGSGSGSSSNSGLQELKALDIHALTLTQPMVLAALTALTWLNVDFVAMPEPAELLSTLPHLQHLQQLNMAGCLGGRHPAMQLSAVRAALQPLTHLTALELSDNGFLIDEQTSPASDQQQHQSHHVFGGLLLPKLQFLAVNRMFWQQGGLPLFTEGQQLAQLAAACPRLGWLQLSRSMAYVTETALQPLTALSPSLTRLLLSGTPRPLCDEHLASLAQLQHLTALAISDAGNQLTDRGLVALTALTELQDLEIMGITSPGVSQELLPIRGRGGERSHAGDTLALQSKTNKNGHLTASVSQQLKDMCNRSPQLWRERQEELNEQLKAARRDIKDARKEALAERKKASAAQKQAWKAQKQAAAAKVEVAALRQQLEALQAQLQQSQESNPTSP